MELNNRIINFNLIIGNFVNSITKGRKNSRVLEII